MKTEQAMRFVRNRVDCNICSK